MISFIALFASLALAQQTPPPAPTPPAAPPEAEATPLETVDVTASQPDRLEPVCRTEPVTGSRFGRRVCRSSLETADERRDSREMLRQMQGSRMPDG